MSYGNPSIGAVLERLQREGNERLLVLPLYPQYSSSTTASVFDAVAVVLRRQRILPALRFINRYFDRPGYAQLLADSIREHWQVGDGQRHLVLSFHGIPKKLREEGDPYVDESLATAESVARALGLSQADYSIGFQSRFGPTQWVEPYTENVLRELGSRGVRRVSVVCPAFAVDCLETLEEVGLELKAGFANLGGDLDLIPALNDRRAHAEFLAGMVIEELRGWR
jgi:ferrochelatase